MSLPIPIEVQLETGECLEIGALHGTRSLADALASNNLPLNTRCGQRGLCRGCEVELLEGALRVNGETVGAPATIKACAALPDAPATVRIPARSRVGLRPQVGETFQIAVPYAHQPLFACDPGRRDTAFAVDVGTTTVVVMLVDLVTGGILSRAGAFNGQLHFGDNVLTRIEAAQKPGNLAALQRSVVSGTIQPLLLRACERAGRSPARIAGGAVAGNTTMLHLLVGADPASLGVAPFTPLFLAGRCVSARDIGLAADGLARETPLRLLPGFAAYVGADIAAGVFACGMMFDSSPSLLVDIGTNGEIVLQNNGKLTACATAAGPAFEGCGLCCGARAREGAISDLRLTLNPFSLETKVIGNVPPARASGLCGSAYLDFLASARSCGLLGPSGRFESAAWDAVPARRRFNSDGGRALRLTQSNAAGALRISEVDVALLLQAKAAVGAGIEILLGCAGLRAADLGRVYLAGGFGMHLNVANAIAIGLLPGFCKEQVRIVGNTALAGAFLALVDHTVLNEMEKLRSQTEIIELNLISDFEDCYIEHLMLP